MTDPLGQSQVIPYLQHLSKEGYRFTILSFEKKARFENEGAVVRKLMEGAGIEWVPLFFSSRPPVLSKIWDRYRMEQTAERLHQQKPFQLVHCRSYVAAEAGLKLKRKYGVKMLFDMRGFWADEKVDNGQWNQGKAFYRRLYRHYKQKEREFLLGADGIISLTEAARDYLLAQPSYKDLSIDVIPCCADLAHFDFRAVGQQEGEKYKRALGIPDGAKVLTYLGSIGGWYMTAEMFRFFALLQQHDPAYVFLVLTKDNPEAVRREAIAFGIPAEKIFVTYSSRRELPVYLSFCSASIFFIRPTFSKTASSPTKHAELMGMGVPVICNDIGDTGRIIRSTGTGMVVDQFDMTTLQIAATQLPELADIDKNAIRRAAFQYFDLETGARHYQSVYERILNEQVVSVG
jgi:glycosyltransferase involved in cell wall biosynthesis